MRFFHLRRSLGCGKEEESPEVFLPQEPSAQEETEWNAEEIINADMDTDVLNTAPAGLRREWCIRQRRGGRGSDAAEQYHGIFGSL